eukprot:jgi/Tetstr1/454170/TSEL_041089.t1
MPRAAKRPAPARPAAAAAKKANAPRPEPRGNTMADWEMPGENSSPIDVAISVALASMQKRTVSMLRQNEEDTPPRVTSYTINELIGLFLEGGLVIYDRAQRNMVFNKTWGRQLMYFIINTKCSVPPIKVRRVAEERVVDGETLSVERYYVVDGAQRLTAILMFYFGLLKADVIHGAPRRRSGRQIMRSRSHTEGGMEPNPIDADEAFTPRFFAPAATYAADAHSPIVFSPPDADGEGHWTIDPHGPLCPEDAPRGVRSFFDTVALTLRSEASSYDAQAPDDAFLSDDERQRFLETRICTYETTWSQQTGSHVNLCQSLQQYLLGICEMLALVGDHLTEWMKTVVPDLLPVSRKWGIGYEMQMALGTLVRAFLIVHGAPYVPGQADTAQWVIMFDYLGANFLAEPPSDDMKACFVAAVRTFSRFMGRGNTKVTSDELVILLALVHYAIAEERLPASIEDTDYPPDIISDNDCRALCGHWGVVKAHGQPGKIKRLAEHFPDVAAAGVTHATLGETLNKLLTKAGQRNLASYVNTVINHLPFETFGSGGDASGEDEPGTPSPDAVGADAVEGGTDEEADAEEAAAAPHPIPSPARPGPDPTTSSDDGEEPMPDLAPGVAARDEH